MRKGITPVVATVLLLMMTVAAAGAFYTFQQGIVGGEQDEATERLNTELVVRDLQCDAATGEVDYLLQNTGSAAVDASSVTVFKYNVSTGALAGTTTVSSSDIEPGSTWGSIAGGSQSTLTGFVFTAGQSYRIEFEFTNQNSYTIDETCQAD